ncbi:unnamed protein product [Strongylus vulgaris]|uniref:Uncharacterized protein n=1 Tax=Strongylus vulgaris TaxID=40348 RepID=A0A3P7HW17_STRVU|nr:unnamed protein product [Strongylus vulgaris]
MKSMSRPHLSGIDKKSLGWSANEDRRVDTILEILKWIPRNAKRPQGRSPIRWADVFVATTEISAVNEYWIWTSRTSPSLLYSSIVDDDSKGRKRMETMLWSA